MFTPLTFYVSGHPAGQPRTKASRRGGFIRIYTPLTVKNAKTGESKRHPCVIWKEQIAGAWLAAARGWVAVRVPVMLTLTFNMPRPKSHFKSQSSAASAAGAPPILKPNAPAFCSSKPDIDNLAKAVMDALTMCGAWQDDNQVVILKVMKQYVQGGEPGCSINIRDAAL